MNERRLEEDEVLEAIINPPEWWGKGSVEIICDAQDAKTAKAIEEKYAPLVEAMRRIATHDGDRWIWDDGAVVDRQDSPQEIARKALRQLEET